MPEMWIVAGPNGAGKTTLTRKKFAAAADLRWVNPDDSTKLLETTYPDLAVAPELMKANLLAAQVSDGRVDHMIATDQSFLVETVLSSLKFMERVAQAKRNGFVVRMVYVTLRAPELAVQRVASRVKDGGHDVDPRKVMKRWAGSLQSLYQFADVVDFLSVWDNSVEATEEAEPILVMDKEPGGPTRIHDVDVLTEITINLDVTTKALGTAKAGKPAADSIRDAITHREK